MNINGLTSGLFLDKRWKTRSGKYPVKFRITINRKSKFFDLSKIDGIKKSYEFFPEDWDKISGKDSQESKESKLKVSDAKSLRLELSEIESGLNKRLESVDEINFAEIDSIILNKRAKGNIFDVYRDEIKRLYNENRPGTASNYDCSSKSLKSFVVSELEKKRKLTDEEKNQVVLTFKDITPKWLKLYENFLIGQGKSISTVGIYLRPLRALFNLTKQKSYPFKKTSGDAGKYQIPAALGTKRALSKADLEKLFNYDSKNEYRQKMLGYWFFSFLCKGMNLADMANLKYKDIKDGKFEFIREKTKNSTRGMQISVTVFLHPIAVEIINKFGNKPVEPEVYIFDIFRNDMTPKDKHLRIKTVVSGINHTLKKIAKEIEISQNIGFYWARHTYTNRLMNEGVSTEYLQKALGHRSAITTARYQGSIEDSKELEITDKLLNF